MRRKIPRRQPVQTSTQRLLKEGYRRRAALNRALAEEWFPLDEEAWEVGQRENTSAAALTELHQLTAAWSKRTNVSP